MELWFNQPSRENLAIDIGDDNFTLTTYADAKVGLERNCWIFRVEDNTRSVAVPLCKEKTFSFLIVKKRLSLLEAVHAVLLLRGFS